MRRGPVLAAISAALACTAPPPREVADFADDPNWKPTLASEPAVDLSRPPDAAAPVDPPPAPPAGYPARREPRLAAGAEHTCAVRSGRVVCWGSLRAPDNHYPIIGPRWLPGLDDAVALAAGARHTCAIRHDRSVTCWLDKLAAPIAIAGVKDIVELAAGGDQTCARDRADAVWCWDRGEHGFTPAARHPGRDGATALALGTAHRCALLPAGLQCDGDDEFGKVTGKADLHDITAVAAGALHTCAIGQAGRVACWGNNVAGQLGGGVLGPHGGRVDVGGLPADVVELELGWMHTCARTREGRVLCWGDNFSGQLGGGDLADRPDPRPVVDLRGVVEIAAGERHTCAEQSTGDIACWGDNIGGQLGLGTDTFRGRPSPIRGLPPAVELAAGSHHACARTDAGAVWCWGGGKHGQLGGEYHYKRLIPAPVPELNDAERLALGDFWSCALRRDGALACWGGENVGDLARSSLTDTSVPREVLRDVLDVAAGRDHLCAALQGGSARCWGANERGQLGDGTITDRWQPAPVPGLSDIVQVAAGTDHGCARARDGRVWCWGEWDERTDERWTRIVQRTPVTIAGIPPAVDLAAREGTTCARARDGALACWGLGAGARARWPAGTADAMAVGANHLCVLRAGIVSCAGSNDHAQLGDGTRTRRDVLAPVAGLPPSRSVAAGRSHSCALDTAGAVRCWGWNNQYGQIGYPELDKSPRPLRVPLD